jgi:hypothetical protein
MGIVKDTAAAIGRGARVLVLPLLGDPRPKSASAVTHALVLACLLGGSASFSFSIYAFFSFAAAASVVSPPRWLWSLLLVLSTMVHLLIEQSPVTRLLNEFAVIAFVVLLGSTLFGALLDDRKRKASSEKARLWWIAESIVLIAILSPAAAMFLKVPWAKVQTERICHLARTTRSPEDLLSKASGLGLRVMSTRDESASSGERIISTTAWEGFVFSRCFCKVTYQGDRVVLAKTSGLD